MIEVINTTNGRATREREASLLAGYGRLRRLRFHDELGWEVRLRGDEERDAYDDVGALYVLAVENDSVLGGLRMMPTTGPNLLHGTFGVLMDDPDAFRDDRLWEITRFCVRGASARSKAVVMRALFHGMLEASRERGIERHVAVTDPTVGRFMRLCGIDMRRLSHDARSFGCPVTLWEWDVDERFAATVLHACDLHGVAANGNARALVA